MVLTAKSREADQLSVKMTQTLEKQAVMEQKLCESVNLTYPDPELGLI